MGLCGWWRVKFGKTKAKQMRERRTDEKQLGWSWIESERERELAKCHSLTASLTAGQKLVSSGWLAKPTGASVQPNTSWLCWLAGWLVWFAGGKVESWSWRRRYLLTLKHLSR